MYSKFQQNDLQKLGATNSFWHLSWRPRKYGPGGNADCWDEVTCQTPNWASRSGICLNIKYIDSWGSFGANHNFFTFSSASLVLQYFLLIHHMGWDFSWLFSSSTSRKSHKMTGWIWMDGATLVFVWHHFLHLQKQTSSWTAVLWGMDLHQLNELRKAAFL